MVDHINRNTLDNRKSNLRICSHSENRCNTGPNKTNQTGYKGVSYCKRDNKYFAMIKKDGKSFCVGEYKDPKDAAIAYNLAAKNLHGEFAYLNTL
jgi:hypothetical protein